MKGPEEAEGGAYTEINITPLVDVALVLLVIFMVTATYIVAESISVDLPKAATGENVVTTLAITIDGKGDIYVDDVKTALPDLGRKVATAHAGNKEVRAVIAADRGIDYGLFVRVVDTVRAAGVDKFAMNVAEEDIVR